jgi:hypothetical protein
MMSAGGVSFSRKPLAPARSAPNTYSSSPNVVSTITFGGAGRTTIRPVGVDAVHLGHPDVHQHHVGPAAADGRDGRGPIARFGNDSRIIRGRQDGPQAGPD